MLSLLTLVGCSGNSSAPTPNPVPSPPPLVITPVPTPQPAPVPPPATGPKPGDFSNAPFEWPAQPVIAELPDARYVSLGSESNDPNVAPHYAGLAQYHNPLPGSHLYAGNIPNGMRLWVQRGAAPNVIRYLLAGNLLPGNRWPTK